MLNKCQIFTPIEYVNKLLEIIDYSGDKILNKSVLENSCGDGKILVEIVDRYIKEALGADYSNSQIKRQLEKNILGFEIDGNVLCKCISNLDAKALEYSISGVKWNISSKDYLKTTINTKVDYVIGNPPYITYQELEVEERTYLREHFESCKTGKFDYCYAFIEKSFADLNKNSGKLVYLIPNSIFKNAFGQNLRNLIIDSLISIHDYKISNVFSNATTSSAIIYLSKDCKNKSFEYFDIDFNKVKILKKKSMTDSKWLFYDNKLDKGNVKFSDYFEVANSVATLLNEAYVIKQYKLDEDPNLIKVGDLKVEKSSTRFAGSPRALAKRRKELIIFPYKYKDGELIRYTEEEFSIKFPQTCEYLQTFKEKLANRNSDKSAKWFEYGRSQALAHLNHPKLLVSSVVTNEVSVYELDTEAIPYSGFYIMPKRSLDLKLAKTILESSQFFQYLATHGINANGKSIRFSVNDIKDYVIDSYLR